MSLKLFRICYWNKADYVCFFYVLLYNNDYIQNIENDLLKLELQYEIGKVLELQEVYHTQFKKLQNNFR